jgi:hypothetical protein
VINDTDNFYRELDELGEERVRKDLANYKWDEKNRPLVEAWLKEKEREGEAEQVRHQETRVEEALKIAQEANMISQNANDAAQKASRKSFWAYIAAVISALCALITVCNQYQQNWSGPNITVVLTKKIQFKMDEGMHCLKLPLLFTNSGANSGDVREVRLTTIFKGKERDEELVWGANEFPDDSDRREPLSMFEVPGKKKIVNKTLGFVLDYHNRGRLPGGIHKFRLQVSEGASTLWRDLWLFTVKLPDKPKNGKDEWEDLEIIDSH